MVASSARPIRFKRRHSVIITVLRAKQLRVYGDHNRAQRHQHGATDTVLHH